MREVSGVRLRKPAVLELKGSDMDCSQFAGLCRAICIILLRLLFVYLPPSISSSGSLFCMVLFFCSSMMIRNTVDGLTRKKMGGLCYSSVHVHSAETNYS